MNIDWDAKTYQSDFGFVPAYGAAVIDLIDPTEARTCLDLGCGDGTLTVQLVSHGFDAVGADASAEMLARARATHPDLRFVQADARCFGLGERFDVVFSNAVLHWIDERDQPVALACVAAALRPGGQFVFECGGHGCAAHIHNALARVFAEHGRTYEVPFFFPTVGEYAPLVEAAGMRVVFATLFDCPTPLAGRTAWSRGSACS